MAVKIDSDLCGHIENCPVQGLCVKICEQGALIEEDGDVTIVPEKCDDCDLCIQNCPNHAISKPSGIICLMLRGAGKKPVSYHITMIGV